MCQYFNHFLYLQFSVWKILLFTAKNICYLACSKNYSHDFRWESIMMSLNTSLKEIYTNHHFFSLHKFISWYLSLQTLSSCFALLRIVRYLCYVIKVHEHLRKVQVNFFSQIRAQNFLTLLQLKDLKIISDCCNNFSK